MKVYNSEVEVPTAAAPAADKPAPQERRALAPRRLRGRALASRLVAISLSSWGASALARALGVTHKTVQRWTDPEHRAALTLGDLLATPPTFALRVLAMALAAVEGHTPPAALEPMVEALDEELSALDQQIRDAVEAGASEGRMLAALRRAEQLCGKANSLCRELRAQLEGVEPRRNDAPS